MINEIFAFYIYDGDLTFSFLDTNSDGAEIMPVEMTHTCKEKRNELSTTTFSAASSFEPDFDTDIDENNNPGPSCRRSVMEVDSDEENEYNETFFRRIRVPKRQREPTPFPTQITRNLFVEFKPSLQHKENNDMKWNCQFYLNATKT